MKIGFIGGGNMAEGIIAGLVKGFLPASIFVADPSVDRQMHLSSSYGINTFEHYRYFLSEVDYIVLAIKPQGFAALLPEMSAHIQPHQVVISIAAGVTVSAITQLLPINELPIVRAMPNMAAKVGHGVTGLYANSYMTADRINCVTEMFEGCGMATWVKDESLINAVIAVAGSSPAYFFYFAEIIGQVGAQMGLNPKEATRMAVETMLGSAKLAAEGESELPDLIRSICSPKGTTEQAMAVFKDNDALFNVVKSAMTATVERSEVLAKSLEATIKGEDH